MEAELYGNELGAEGDLHANEGKGSLNCVSNFEEIIRDIDEAIEYDHRSSNSNEGNPYISSAREGSKASGVAITMREEDSELNMQELEIMGTLNLGTPCTTSHAVVDFNLGWDSNVVAEGGSKGRTTTNNKLKGTLGTKGGTRNKQVEHARAVKNSLSRGRGQRVGGRISILSDQIVTNVESGSKRKGGAGCMHADIKEGREKRLNVDEEVSTLSVILATQLGLAEVAGQSRQDQ